MSVILKIRKNGKLAGGVIALSLSIWILMEGANNSSLKDFFRGSSSNSVMTINGTKIQPKEFEIRAKEMETLMAVYNPQQKMDEAGRAQIREQVMQVMILDAVLGKQCDKLGITTTDEEKNELIYGANADQLVKRFSFQGQALFNNPETGAFDPARVKGIEKDLANPPKDANPQIYEKINEQFSAVKEYVVRMNRINKFNAIFTSSVYSPLYQSKKMLEDRNAIASIRLVKVPYSSIPDNKVTVTDDDLNNFIQKHKAMFEIDQPVRGIEFVSVDIVPSATDTASVLSFMADIKHDFASTKDNKNFVNSKSDDASFSEAFVNKKMLTTPYVDSIFAKSLDSIYGPYYENGFYKMTKVTERKTLPDSVKCRHILIKTKDKDKDMLDSAVAQTRIDSIVNAIKGGASFDTMVVKFSDDDGSKKDGGVYWWSLAQRQGLSKEFGDFVFDGHPGEKKTVHVSNPNYSGYHYIEILEHKNPSDAIKIATVTKILTPSETTSQDIFNKANEFAGKSANAADFDKNIKTFNLEKKLSENIRINTFNINNIGASRELIRWLFEHKIGDISGAIEVEKQKYVIAKITSAQEKGTSGITSSNRPMLEQRVKDEMKAKQIIQNCQGKPNLEAIATATSQQVQQFDTIAVGNSLIPGLGYEPKVVGYAFYSGLQPNAVSPGIKGAGGVYFISVLNRRNNPEDPQFAQRVQEDRARQEGQLRNALGQMMQTLIPKMADIKYYPANF